MTIKNMTREQLIQELETMYNVCTEQEGRLKDQNRTIDELRSDKSTLDAILGAMEDGLTIQDRDYNIIYQNELLKNTFGGLWQKCYAVYQGKEGLCDGCPDELAFHDGMSHTSEMKVIMPSGKTTYWENIANPLRNAGGEIISCLNIVRNITNRKLAVETIRESEEKFHKISASATDAILMIDNNGCISFWNEAAAKIFGYTSEEAMGKDIHNLIIPESYREAHVTGFQGFKETGEGSVIGETLELEAIKKDGMKFPVELSISAMKLKEQWHAIGILRDISERKISEKNSRDQLKRFAALRSIDMSINSSLDLRLTLEVILNQVISQLMVDASNILLYRSHLQTLEYAAGTGFRTQALQFTRLKIGEGFAGQAALEQHRVHISDLREKDNGFKRSQYLDEEGFITYYGVPLIAKGVVKGVLEVFNRTKINPDNEWLNFLDALAGQAAIAIDNATLFDNLQRSNIDLVMAYDATIEGWARALDLRDKETEGHSRRVTELTLKIARAMGIGEAEQADMRRGALLHDIGKMGVPDRILQKPGPLDDDEWKIMSKHPIFAYEMLSPIAYLRPALDIPYCHHEKWDGTGYPRGLKGEQIPLGARIFAVVDIFDALRSDRPYRPAWPKEKVLGHIESISGNHLDPKVLEQFLKIETETMDLPT